MHPAYHLSMNMRKQTMFTASHQQLQWVWSFQSKCALVHLEPEVHRCVAQERLLHAITQSFLKRNPEG